MCCSAKRTGNGGEKARDGEELGIRKTKKKEKEGEREIERARRRKEKVSVWSTFYVPFAQP